MTEGDHSADDTRALAEAIADVLAERGLVGAAAPAPTARVLSVSDVARLLGRNRAWVYDHAAELGAFRFGKGPKARLGFDLTDVERWKRERQIEQPGTDPLPRRRRSRQEGLPRGTKLIPYEGSG